MKSSENIKKRLALLALLLWLFHTIPQSQWHGWLAHHQDHLFADSANGEVFQDYQYNCGFLDDFSNISFDIQFVALKIYTAGPIAVQVRTGSLFIPHFIIASGIIPRAPPKFV